MTSHDNAGKASGYVRSAATGRLHYAESSITRCLRRVLEGERVPPENAVDDSYLICGICFPIRDEHFDRDAS